MPVTRTSCRIFVLLFVFLQTNYLSFSQTSSFPIKQWVKKLADKNGPSASGIDDLVAVCKRKDSSEVFALFNELEKKGNNQNHYFTARLFSAKAKYIWQVLGKGRNREEEVTQLGKQALSAAYETNSDSLISEMAWSYGLSSYHYTKIEPAAMYCLYAAELDNKTGKKSDANKCLILGGVLYETRDYEKAIYYTQASIERETETSSGTRRLVLSRYNTVGVCYQRMGNYDSAFFYYDLAMKLAAELNDTVWKAIVSGNKGQIYYLRKDYAIAKPLLMYDYRVSKRAGEQASAANSLQWVARINLVQGKKDSSLMQIKEALQLVKEKTDVSSAYYWQNIYYAAADVYRAFGNNDSVIKYSGLYGNVHDSIERAVADSRLEISRIKLDNLQNVLAIKNLQKEKETAVLKRNFILLAIILTAVIVILILNRQKQRLAHKQQINEAEMNAARKQMDLFKQSIIEKTSLIEKLQDQVRDEKTTAEQIQILEALSQQTILTEQDWEKFKTLFEKIYPGFFLRLKEKSPDITVAEQRMAALTRLHLTSKQMAAMLGISVDSVHKTRQRLRQRLHLGADINLEETIAYL